MKESSEKHYKLYSIPFFDWCKMRNFPFKLWTKHFLWWNLYNWSVDSKNSTLIFRFTLVAVTATTPSSSSWPRSTGSRTSAPSTDSIGLHPDCCCSAGIRRRPGRWNSRFVQDKCKSNMSAELKGNFQSEYPSLLLQF